MLCCDRLCACNALSAVSATRYQQYTTCACLLVTFGACQRKGTVSTSAIRSTVKDINMEKGYVDRKAWVKITFFKCTFFGKVAFLCLSLGQMRICKRLWSCLRMVLKGIAGVRLGLGTGKRLVWVLLVRLWGLITILYEGYTQGIDSFTII